MRTRRIKVIGQTAVYHCITRVVGGELLLGDKEKEILRKQLWRVAGFCGVEVLTYCVMSNHLHVLVRVPEEESVSDDELVRRFGFLYDGERGRVEAFRGILQQGGEDAERLRGRLLARMGDVSGFMKELKQRFSIWYNHSHSRYGTLWAERFKSVLVENTATALRTVAAYIDLNPVRAGLVKDPKDYRFCGYAEALAGAKQAQAGMKFINERNRIAENHTLFRAQRRYIDFDSRFEPAIFSIYQRDRVLAHCDKVGKVVVVQFANDYVLCASHGDI